MKYFFFALFFSFGLYAQSPCEWSRNFTDSIGTYKETKESLVYERNFGGTSSYVFFSLSSANGTPLLNVQFLQKSKDFIKANCLEKGSKIYLQLNNGKIVTLIYADEQDNCGTTLRDEKGFNNRILSGVFMFVRGSFEDLKVSPVSLMRIKFGADMLDYVLRSELKSENDGKTYHPEKYFMDSIPCLD